jgi:hypothetical protein
MRFSAITRSTVESTTRGAKLLHEVEPERGAAPPHACRNPRIGSKPPSWRRPRRLAPESRSRRRAGRSRGPSGDGGSVLAARRPLPRAPRRRAPKSSKYTPCAPALEAPQGVKITRVVDATKQGRPSSLATSSRMVPCLRKKVRWFRELASHEALCELRRPGRILRGRVLLRPERGVVPEPGAHPAGEPARGGMKAHADAALHACHEALRAHLDVAVEGDGRHGIERDARELLLAPWWRHQDQRLAVLSHRAPGRAHRHAAKFPGGGP